MPETSKNGSKKLVSNYQFIATQEFARAFKKLQKANRKLSTEFDEFLDSLITPRVTLFRILVVLAKSG